MVATFRVDHLVMVHEQLFKVFGPNDWDLRKELALDEGCIGVVQHSPNGWEVFELSACLFDDVF